MPLTSLARAAAGSFLMLLFAASLAAAEQWSVTSPDMRTRITLRLDDGELSYTASLQRTPPAWQVEASGFETVIESSPLGVVTREQAFDRNLSFVEAGEVVSRSEPYTMITGKRSYLDNHYSERVVRFHNRRGAAIELHLRAYADGVAFRYHFPAAEGAPESYTVTDEATGFHLPEEGRAWMAPYSPVDTWAPAYETDYEAGIPIGTGAPEPVGWGFPALFESGGIWTLLTESNLDGDFFAVHLQPTAKGGLYQVRLPEEDETYGVHPRASTARLPFDSPWRVIMLATDPGGILESSLVHHLADPNQLEDTDWIEPGPSTWSWLFDHSSQTDFGRLVPFIDLAAELGWPYSMVDADWHIMRNGDILQAIDYADERGVDLTVWYNSGGPTNLVKPIGPADRLHLPEVRQKEMAWLESIGVRGIKVDFMQSDKQGQIQLYLDIIRDAARHHLMVFFHGSTLPRGWERTWPNLVSMEAVKGGEQLWSQEFADAIAVHNTILPFTRNVVGSMDYTPFLFQGMGPEITTSTTWPHELATTIAFESGIQHVSETVENFERLPYFVWRFLEDLEVAWDETLHLAGEPGDHVVLARRKGTKWFVAGLNGRDEPLTVEFTPGFLPRGPHAIELIVDGAERTSFEQRKLRGDQNDSIQVEMAPRGGFTATFAPARW